MSAATPRELGYRMPAEWAPQEAVWLCWPHNLETWPAPSIEDVRRSYVEVIRALHPGQRIKLLVEDAAAEAAVRAALTAAGVDISSITFLQVPSQDSWIRDYGPTFVVNPAAGRLGMVKWDFNAWGGKYEDLLADTAIPYEINRGLGLPLFEAGIVLEGGSIEVNGAGTVLTTEQCLLNPNRNPNLTRKDIEGYLVDFLGASNVLWLGEGIDGDDTDGHIDDIVRFVDERTVVCAFEDDPADANYKVLEDNFQRLVRSKDQDGRSLDVIRLPMPGYVGDADGRLPASYANFYIGNGAVVVPVFGHENDRRALETLGTCLPGRRIVGVDCRAMVSGLGAIHCCSQQEPRV